jgi:hypothetical protein
MSGGLSKSSIGAWLLHHDQKLQNAKTTAFDNIALSGRAARLLSVVSREDEFTVQDERVHALAQGLGIRRYEVDGLLAELARHGLVDRGRGGVAVLGVSQVSLLDHAADIFGAQSPLGTERAVIDLAERGSVSPLRRGDCEEELRDTYKLSATEADDVFTQSEHIGFVDYEKDGAERLYFNGSLFRRGDADKARRVLDGLDADEVRRVTEADGRLSQGCVLADDIRAILGPKLWSKLHQIGFYDLSAVANESGATEFVTKPEALAKFIPNGLADMLDDAKALASSLTYGIVRSHDARGRIKDPSALVGALVGRGYVEGRANAISRDYKILERRGVVHVAETSRGYRLTLLKREVGQMASDLLLQGNASGTAAELLASAAPASFVGPETLRVSERNKDIPEARAEASRTLNILRNTRV